MKPGHRYLNIPFFILLGVLMLLWIASSVRAEIQNLDLGRMILIYPDEIPIDGPVGPIFSRIWDTHTQPERPHGRLVIETDTGNIIRTMDITAWVRGDPAPVFQDVVVVLDWSANGARYEVMSLWTDEQYFITFLRRAPVDSGYDPATIILIELEDGVIAQLDYRYADL